jgi:hypothetical protein
MMVAGINGDAGKYFRSYSGDKAKGNLIDGGRLQRHQQNSLLKLNALQCAGIQSHAGRDLQ